jgi:hypothetical protein
MKRSFKSFIMTAVLNRYIIVVINLLLIFIIFSIVITLVRLLKTPENDIKEMVELCNGIAIILYGYGVSMEFRRQLMTYLGIYPACDSPLQKAVDTMCQKYGIFFLLLGLFLEILVHLVTIPNAALNTEGKESYVFTICLFILVFVFWLQLYFTYKLIRTSGRTATCEDVSSPGEEIN